MISANTNTLLRRTFIRSILRSVHTEAHIAKLGIKFPPAPPTAGSFVPAVKVGNIMFISGQLPINDSGDLITGTVPTKVDPDAANAAARLCGLQIIQTIKKELGDLDKVKRIVKIGGFVQCESDFTMQPAVVNGCSDLMKEVFGDDRGAHTRTAVGTNALPLDVSVECDAIIEFEE